MFSCLEISLSFELTNRVLLSLRDLISDATILTVSTIWGLMSTVFIPLVMTNSSTLWLAGHFLHGLLPILG